MAYTFLKSQGYEIGGIHCWKRIRLNLAGSLIKEAKDKNVELLLPCDVVVTEELKQGLPYQNSSC